MELNNLILMTEKGKECRDMIHILLSLGYPPEAIIACVNAYCKTEITEYADFERIKNEIEILYINFTTKNTHGSNKCKI